MRKDMSKRKKIRPLLVILIAVDIIILSIVAIYFIKNRTQNEDAEQTRMQEEVARSPYDLNSPDANYLKTINALISNNRWDIGGADMLFGGETSPVAFEGYFDDAHTAVKAGEGYTYTLWIDEDDFTCLTISNKSNDSHVTYTVIQKNDEIILLHDSGVMLTLQ